MSPAPEPLPSFHDAVARFRSEMKSRGRPETVVWIDPNDLIIARNRLHVRLRNPPQMWIKAQCRYDAGVNSKRGVALRQLCSAPGLSCCYVDVVDPPGLQLVAPDEPMRAVPVSSRLQWIWLKSRARSTNQALPSTMR